MVWPLTSTSVSGEQCGTGCLEVKVVAGLSAITRVQSRTPLKLLTPRARGESVWSYTSSFGGGLVAGDQVRIDVELGPGARCFLGSQSSTKVYRSPNRAVARHRVEADLGSGSLLVLAPDPIQCFAGAIYEQHQSFRLAHDAGLVLVELLSSGRSGCGERWAFQSFDSRNVVWVNGELVLLDRLLLDPRDGALDKQERMGRFNCFGTVVLAGTICRPAADGWLDRIVNRPVGRSAPMIVSASPLRAGGVIVRIAGISVEQVARTVLSELSFVCELLQGNPWSRKW